MPLGVLTSALKTAENPRSFKKSLQGSSSLKIIAEVKHASPIKGFLRSDFDPVRLAEAYENGGAGAVSVITEQTYFKGNPGFIVPVKAATRLPVLRKDFIFSDYQVFESRVIGADAILLIAAILDDYLLRRLIKLAADLGMDALVEIHDHSELKKAIKAGAGIIGINNRNLKTFQVSISTTLELAGEIPDNVLLVSESGISTREDILKLEQAGAKAALIGETLVRSENPSATLKELQGQTVVKGA